MLSSAELAAMRATQQTTFWDTCVVLRPSGALDSFGQPTGEPVPGDPMPCRFFPQGSREQRGMEQHLVTTDSTLRLPLSASVQPGDLVRITHRYGEALITPQTFEVASDPAPMRGPTAITVGLLKVTR